MTEIKLRMPASLSMDEYSTVIMGNKVTQDPRRNSDEPLVVVQGTTHASPYNAAVSLLFPSVSLQKKLVAEVISTFILVFTGCGAVMVNSISNGKVTPVGISLVFGLVITIMIYSVGHISGAHMNPAVTLAFAIARHFPWTQVPMYMVAQCGGSILASFLLRWILHPSAFEGATLPTGSNIQSFLLEIVITFILMFVVAAVATDTRARGELAGIAIGSCVALNAIMAGPISGASMNPARSLGPAVASGNYQSIWVYMTGPTIGALMGILAYNCIRLPDTEVQCDTTAKNST